MCVLSAKLTLFIPAIFTGCMCLFHVYKHETIMWHGPTGLKDLPSATSEIQGLESIVIGFNDVHGHREYLDVCLH